MSHTRRTTIYLDNNATTPLDPRVLDAMLPVFSEHFGNPASATHAWGWYAAELVTIARERVANLIRARPEEIIFTSGATESCNLALKGAVAAAPSSAPKQLITVTTEHRATLDPLRTLGTRGWKITELPVQRDGTLEMKSLEHALQQGAYLVSVLLANNEIGVLHDVPAIAALARRHGALIHCDATQALGKLQIDVTTLGVDFLSCSAHKLYGPKGIGALFVRESTRQQVLAPLLEGGGHERGYRSGTLNTPGIVGFGMACEIAAQSLHSDAHQMTQLAHALLTRLEQSLGPLPLNGPGKERLPGNLNIVIPGVDSSRLLGALGTTVALSASSACQSATPHASHVLTALGLPPAQQRQSIRIGIGRFTTEADVEGAASAITHAAEKIRRSAT
ncbi:MAG: cysteine desulfurase [Bdellovibrionales bacterium]|nr:cysteine desulfurase [Bdellovibrionales bacterium]